MQLIVAEKPSVSQDLANALPGSFKQHEGYWEGENHLISWAVGHLLELAEPEDYNEELKRWALETLPILPEKFRRKVRQGQKKQLQLLKKLANRPDVESIVNACDAAREGELIFREIEEFVSTDKPVYRLWLQSMTASAIRSAFEQLESAEKYAGLGDAAYCRAESDWIIGMNATRGITRRLKGRRERGVWSAGRVQTPTLALLVHRELAVLAHVPVPFWRVKGQFEANGDEYQGVYRRTRSGKDVDKIWEEADAKAIQDACQGKATAVVEKVSESHRKPPLLHSLTSLQKEANSRFGLSARRTLGAAQRLYEQHKALTYPRTDSVGLPEDYGKHVDGVVADLASDSAGIEGCFSEGQRADAIVDAASQVKREGLKNSKRNFDDGKVSDHFAIIPTGTWPTTPLGGDDAKVFELVVRRFLAAFMGPSTWQKVVRTTTIGEYDFFTESSRMVKAGWQLVDRRPPSSEQLGDLGVQPGETAKGVAQQVDIEEDATRPPARFTEAGLLKAMESASDLDLDYHNEIDDDEVLEALKSKGLGTPATRADTIEALIAKGYAIRTGKSLRPTPKGITLIDFLQRIDASHLAKADMTAEMEFHLHQVEQGQRQRDDYMREVETTVKDLVEKLQTFDYGDLYDKEEPLGKCPNTGAPLQEGLRGYRCQHDDEEKQWTLWKEFRGRYINRPVAERILNERDSGPVEGFVNMRGQTYAGRILLDDELKMVFEPVKDWKGSDDEGAVAPELVSYPVDESPFVKCPKCKEGMVTETPTHFECRYEDKEEGCGLTMPRTVCKREMRRPDLLPWLSDDEHTEWMEDFISKKGRPFTARLIRKENGRHGFEFKPRAAKKKTTKKKATKKKTTKKKAAKKTTKKKTTKKATKKTAATSPSSED